MADVNFKILNDWNNGFQGEIAIENDSNVAIEDWTLQFTVDFEIQQLWNAEIVSRDGNTYTVKYLTWNKDINVGSSVSFGFIGTPLDDAIDEPTNYFLNGDSLNTEDLLPALNISDASVIEGNDGLTYLNYVVTLDSPSSEVVTVDFNTGDGTAIVNSDYQSLTGNISFDIGETSKTIQIAVIGDESILSQSQYPILISCA